MSNFGRTLGLTALAWSLSVAVQAATAQGTPSTPASGRPAPVLLSPYRNYRLPLTPFVPSLARTRGALLQVRINGGQPVHLLLDSGARDLVLKEKVARKFGVRALSAVGMVSVGKTSVDQVPMGLARRIDIGPFALADVPTAIVTSGLAEGLDGVVPTILFCRFLIKINFKGKLLELLPYIDGGETNRGRDSIIGNSHNGILFLPAILESKQGYLVVDTGAAYNAIATPVAKQLRLARSFAPSMDLEAGGGPVAGQSCAPANVRIGYRNMVLDDVLAVSLEEMSQFHGVEIMGLLGFPALEHSQILIDYRESQLTLGLE
jgi:predicted aspartyl protease